MVNTSVSRVRKLESTSLAAPVRIVLIGLGQACATGNSPRHGRKITDTHKPGRASIIGAKG